METDGLLVVTTFLQLFTELLKKPFSSPKLRYDAHEI